MSPGLRLRFGHAPGRPADDVCVSVAFADDAAVDVVPKAPFRLPARKTTNRNRYLLRRIQSASAEALALEARAFELLESTLAPSERPAKPYGERQIGWYAERIDAARERLDGRPDEAPPLAALARSVGMSPFHFARLFRELVGVPPHRYLVEARLRRAVAVLREGASVTEAGFMSGFGNLSHFIRTFQKRYGASPGTFARGRANSQETARRR